MMIRHRYLCIGDWLCWYEQQVTLTVIGLIASGATLAIGSGVFGFDPGAFIGLCLIALACLILFTMLVFSG